MYVVSRTRRVVARHAAKQTAEAGSAETLSGAVHHEARLGDVHIRCNQPEIDDGQRDRDDDCKKEQAVDARDSLHDAILYFRLAIYVVQYESSYLLMPAQVRIDAIFFHPGLSIGPRIRYSRLRGNNGDNELSGFMYIRRLKFQASHEYIKNLLMPFQNFFIIRD